MKNWLFIWNPSRWAWDSTTDGYNELRLEIEQNGFSFCKWSCGVNRSIQKGDRIFLMRLGCAKRGIVASGCAETSPFEGTHWDAEKALKGVKARRIYIRFDKVVDIDFGEYLPYEKLLEVDPGYHWSPQCSGVSIPEETAKKIESIWKEI